MEDQSKFFFTIILIKHILAIVDSVLFYNLETILVGLN